VSDRIPRGSFEPPSSLPGRDGPVLVHAVYFDGAEPVLDNGALHGRSEPERGVRFGEDAAADGRGRRVRVVWVATPDAGPDAPFLGMVASDYWVDAEARTGFKKLAVHTNGICAAAAGKVDVAALEPAQRKALAAVLERLAPEGWKRTSPLIKLFLAQ
jgi:hypothetical protein